MPGSSAAAEEFFKKMKKNVAEFFPFMI